MKKELVKILTKKRRKQRVRTRVTGIKTYPRLSVFRSNQHIYAQIIDDVKGKTLFGVGDQKVKKEGKTKIKIAHEVGKLIAKKAIKENIKKVVFDRGGYKYHGRVKAVAEGARAQGLKF